MLIPYKELKFDLDDTNTDKLLNKAADYVEQLCEELRIPLIVHGGSCGTKPVNYVKMHVRNCMQARRDLDAAGKLSRKLRKAFNCRIAGLDTREDVIWLWDIKEN